MRRAGGAEAPPFTWSIAPTRVLDPAFWSRLAMPMDQSVPFVGSTAGAFAGNKAQARISTTSASLTWWKSR